MRPLLFVLIGVIAALAEQATPQKHNAMDPNSCPMHAEHRKVQTGNQRFAEMQERGNRSMGFDQNKTTHHFRSLEDGGAIEVTVNDSDGAADLNAVRNHLLRTAKQFAAGDFSSPMMTHGELPPGAAEMQNLKDKIAYTYEELPGGARVKITTGDPKALAAVHQFLSYQIKEHRTGDALPAHRH